jgi:hypothetical protein
VNALSRLRQHPPRWLAVSALLAALLAPGCGRSKPGFVLAPTGVRPVPAVPSGGIWGYLTFDPTHYTGLDQAPYPRAEILLTNSAGQHVDSLAMAGDSRRFEFDQLAPGHYSITVRSHAFKLASFGSFSVSTWVQDVGDKALSANYDSLTSECYVIGTMPGFSTDEFGTYSTFMDQNDVGVWTYPGEWGSTPVPAGTYRFKFVTDASSTPNHLIGWGGDSTQVLTVPVTNAPLRRGTGPASDLKVTFPSPGTYHFTFDERRLTFSITLGTAPLRAARGVSRRAR